MPVTEYNPISKEARAGILDMIKDRKPVKTRQDKVKKRVKKLNRKLIKRTDLPELRPLPGEEEGDGKKKEFVSDGKLHFERSLRKPKSENSQRKRWKKIRLNQVIENLKAQKDPEYMPFDYYKQEDERLEKISRDKEERKEMARLRRGATQNSLISIAINSEESSEEGGEMV